MLSHVTNLGFVNDYGAHYFPDRPAVADPELRLTHAQLDRRANQVANGLLGVGVGRGERVALLWSNEARYLESLLGVMRAGGVAVPVNTRLGIDQMQYLVADAGAQVLLASRDLGAVAQRLATGMTPTPQVIAVDGGTGAGATDYEGWLAAAEDAVPPVQVSGGDLCMQPYTSGSTGRPNGVLLHHAGQIHNAEMMRRALMVGPDERALVAVPVFHANALCAAILPFLLAGASIVIRPSFNTVDVIRTIATERCTYMTGVPAMYTMLLSRRSELSEHDLSSITCVACGSAPATAQLIAGLNDAFQGAEVLEGYGLTEGGPIVLFNPRWGVKRLGSVGVPLPAVHVRLVGDDRRDVPSGEVGELWVNSPGNARGYHNLLDVTTERFSDDGWLRTGDLMHLDEQGNYYFLGRSDDMINCGGDTVYPKEVENLLLGHPAVADASVVPVPHDLKGEVPVAFGVRMPGSKVREDELQRFCLDHGPAYAHPRRICFVATLPLSGTGKVDRVALTERARSLAVEQPGSTADQAPGTPEDR